MSSTLSSTRTALSISDALETIENLSLKTLQSNGAWSTYKILTHCAQSVECSILGYPKQNSKLFQKTIGKLAFYSFSFLGQMHHPLDEEIPCAPDIEDSGNLDEALQRLNQAYLDFSNYTGPLSPHFAYGELSREEYSLAHVMHLNNHLQEIQVL